MAEPQREEFLRLVFENPVNAALLDRLPELGLPDWHLVSGCLFQTVWNHLSGKPPTHGVLDYDVFYWDAADLSWEAEDAAIQRVARATADLGFEVQVRNQARVHLWYPEKHGVAYAPLASSREGIDRFLSRASCVGVSHDTEDGLEVYAPFGFDELFSMIVRPNPRIELPGVYYQKAARWREAWPDLTVEPWPERTNRRLA